MFTFLLVVQGIVAAALIGVILMQKSEGGGLGVGGSPAGFLSARGAADFLTRATAILASLFVFLCIVLAVLASVNHGTTQIDADAVNKVGAVAPTAAAPAAPETGVPIAGGAAAPLAGAAAAAETAAPTAQTPAQQGVPLQQ